MKFDEIQINLANSIKIAGKFYGNKSLPTILCLHGREDNAGTFDRLISLLPSHFSYLALDLPGHGHSSRLPNGIFYNPLTTFTLLINQIIDFYGWKCVSIIAHSLSSRLAFVYASLCPQRVDMVIGIDVLKPQVFGLQELRNFARNFDKFHLTDMRNLSDDEPPAYEYNVMVNKLVEGSFGSVTKEFANHLLARNAKKSIKNPENFYFSRDRRLSVVYPINLPQEVQIEMAKRLTMPYLYVNAKESFYKVKNRQCDDDEVLKILKMHPNFEHHEIDSKSHHLHLTEVEKIAGILSNFINKHKIVRSHL